MALKPLMILVFVAVMALMSVAEAQNTVGIVHVNGTSYCTADGSPAPHGTATPVFSSNYAHSSPFNIYHHNMLRFKLSAPTTWFNSPSNATSNGNGVYLVVLLPRPNPSIASIVSNCRLFVLTPLSTCNPSLPSAALVSNLKFVRSVQVGFAWITYMVATTAKFKKMNSLSATGFFPKYPVLHYAKRRRYCSRVPAVFSTLKASPPPLNEFAGDDVLREFLKERELSGDFIAKLSDELWLRGVVNSKNLGEIEGIADNQKFNSASQLLEDVGQESEGGFLKLKRTSEWLLGDDNSAPMNRKMTSKEVRDDGERRKRLNFLRYEALKRELLLLTVSIGSACSGYCLIALSVQVSCSKCICSHGTPDPFFTSIRKSFGSEGNKIQDDIASVFSVVFVMLHGHHRDQTSDPAAVSYATGVIFSCLYFQLLCKHADNISREAVPEVFTKKKSKKIGIRSEDLQDFVERTLRGSGIALSSPRLVIPAAIYGLWELSQHFANDIFDFQLVPAMVGLFAYKAAALVQVYRDNEDLQFIFPENTDRSKLQSSLPMAKSQSPVLVEPVYSSVIALLIIVMACVELCDAVTVVDVYRLVQYDLAGVPFGSRLAALNHHAGSSLFSSSAASGAVTDLSRTVLILPVRELNLTFIREYIGQKKPFGGLLLLLPQVFNPQNVDSGGGSDHDSATKVIKEVLVELEKLLLHANIPYPVYFGFEDDHVNAVLADVKKNDATGQPATATTGGYKLVVAAPEPKKIASPAIANIQGWLPGLKADGDSNQLPTIAVVASYDTFGAAPALSVGSDSNGSGVVALLEIARLFSVLYSSAKTRGRYNLLFVLTSGGPYNYNGTHKWLRSLDQRLRETIDYAICLNSIGSSNNDLWIHVSKPPDNVYIKQIFEVASVTFDLLLLLVLGSYLITLFCFLVITTRGLDDLISLFRRPTSRKVKTA
ncbi:UNVERIFIED_CONTAM: Nicalin [Sesamum calycinum]|uniref:Nicalin n=1 Tax=Sesamum calycinum TaxID=2727403 RepID=A0AAW2SD59_9LAMI